MVLPVLVLVPQRVPSVETSAEQGVQLETSVVVEVLLLLQRRPLVETAAEQAAPPPETPVVGELPEKLVALAQEVMEGQWEVEKQQLVEGVALEAEVAAEAA